MSTANLETVEILARMLVAGRAEAFEETGRGLFRSTATRDELAVLLTATDMEKTLADQLARKPAREWERWLRDQREGRRRSFSA